MSKRERKEGGRKDPYAIVNQTSKFRPLSTRHKHCQDGDVHEDKFMQKGYWPNI